MEVRKFLDANGFIALRSPMLTKSTPEWRARLPGASRVPWLVLRALPQSPQLFKHMLLGRLDRYYQITSASATEVLRPTASPSSRRIDVETSF